MIAFNKEQEGAIEDGTVSASQPSSDEILVLCCRRAPPTTRATGDDFDVHHLFVTHYYKLPVYTVYTKVYLVRLRHNKKDGNSNSVITHS